MNSLSFYWSENVCICLHIRKIILLSMEILTDIFFPFSTWNILSHCLMFSIVFFFYEKPISLLRVLLYVPNCFPLAAFKIFSCSMLFVCVVFCMTILIKSISSTVCSLWCCSSEAQQRACAQSPWHLFLSEITVALLVSLFLTVFYSDACSVFNWSVSIGIIPSY